MVIMFSSFINEFLQRNVTVIVVILAVLAARFILKKVPKKYSYALWSIAAVKMIFDFDIPSSFSVFNFLLKAEKGNPLLNGYQVARMNAVMNYVISGDHTIEPGTSNMLDILPSNQQSLTTVQNAFMVFGILWITGFILFIIYGALSYYRCKKKVEFAVKCDDDIWECDDLPSPFVLGLIHPQAYVPFHMPAKEYEYIIAHEKYHMKRRDGYIKLLAFLLLAVYWINPFVWIAYICVVRDMEMSCDEAVISSLGSDIKKSYSKSLLAFATGKKNISFVPLAFGESDASKRIKNILDYKKPRFWAMIIAILVIAITSIACLTNMKSQSDLESKEELADELESSQGQESSPIVSQKINKWAEAFVNRDTDTIIDMSTKEVQQSLEEGGLLTVGDNYVSFGFSSPWPVSEFNYMIASQDDQMNTANIVYYAWTSDPHISAWSEMITYDFEGDNFSVVKEELHYLDSIASGNEYLEAYPFGINKTPMDYLTNDLGETLNSNALLSSSNYYKDLFKPESAARVLLNLSNDNNKVKIEVIQDGTMSDTKNVRITFLEDGVIQMIKMIQPWGEYGIWIPQDYENTKE